MLEPPPVTYFGLWSARDLRTVSQLLEGLGVRYEVNTENDVEEGRLKSWFAWDENANDPCTAFHLWIRDEDVALVGTRIVDLFPYKRF